MTMMAVNGLMHEANVGTIKGVGVGPPAKIHLLLLFIIFRFN